MRVLVGGIGYRYLMDHSLGVLVADTLAARAWPPGVAVEDLSFNPVAVAQRLQDPSAGAGFDLAVFVAAVTRPGRAPGALSIYRWDQVLPDVEVIQDAVAEAVTGVIALDNTLIVTRHLGALPPQVVVVEVEPLLHAFGETLSDAVALSFATACDAVARLALHPHDADAYPVFPLGGGAPRERRTSVPRVSDVTG